MRLIVTGGGTGGHIYPAIAIAKRVRKAIPDCDILYAGGMHGLEKDIVKREEIAFYGIDVLGFNRRSFLKRLIAYFKLIVALFQSFNLMRKYRPDLVIGTGGYVSGPVVLVASLMGIDTMIHEQNVVPGFTTRKLEKHVKKILLSFKESMVHFKAQNKLYYTGVPIRAEFLNADRQQARKIHQLADDQLLIVSLGGSGGAATINKIATSLAYHINKRNKVKLVHITGKRYYADYIKALDDTRIADNVTVVDYLDNIQTLLSAADLVISRAGALSLSEFTALSLPALLIPSPNVADNHQFYNAKAHEKMGTALLIEEKALDIEALINIIDSLIENPEQLENMRKNYEAHQREDALSTIMSIIFSYQLR